MISSKLSQTWFNTRTATQDVWFACIEYHTRAASVTVSLVRSLQESCRLQNVQGALHHVLLPGLPGAGYVVSRQTVPYYKMALPNEKPRSKLFQVFKSSHRGSTLKFLLTPTNQSYWYLIAFSTRFTLWINNQSSSILRQFKICRIFPAGPKS